MPPKHYNALASRCSTKLVHLLSTIPPVTDHPGVIVPVAETLGYLSKIFVYFNHDPRMADVPDYKGEMGPLTETWLESLKHQKAVMEVSLNHRGNAAVGNWSFIKPPQNLSQFRRRNIAIGRKVYRFGLDVRPERCVPELLKFVFTTEGQQKLRSEHSRIVMTIWIRWRTNDS